MFTPVVVVREHRDGAVLVLAVEGTVDMVTAPRLLAAVRAGMQTLPPVLVIDLTAVTFLAAAGLHVLDVARAEAGEQMLLAVVASGPVTARPMEITGRSEIVDTYPTVTEVLSHHAA
jgi:anti-anti-sigma factor